MPKTAAPLITVKTKYQLTLPTAVRKAVGVGVGDILEAKVEGKKITLTPKSIVDRELALALADVKAGRTYGPFNLVDEMLHDLHRRATQFRKGKRKARAS